LKKHPFGGDQEYKLTSLAECVVGVNKGVILSCKALRTYTNAGNIPAYILIKVYYKRGFIVVDVSNFFGCLSVYHCS
jgi:hypothetical protein